MIKTILLNTTTRQIVSIVETIDSMYTVGQLYNGLLAVSSDGLPNVSDEELVSLWYYTTTNTWLQNTASPGIFYLWNYNLATNTYSWVLTNPSPVLSITTTVGFKQVNLSWTITDTNYPDIFYLVDISTNNFTSTLVADKYLSYIDENTTTTARTYYLRPYWLNDVGAVVYGTIYNTGSVTPSSIQSIDVATGVVNSQLAGTGVNICNPRYTSFEEATLPPISVSNGVANISTTSLLGSKSLQLTATVNDCYAYLGVNAADYNVNITPLKKWIASFYVYSTVAIPSYNSATLGVELLIRTNAAGNHYSIANSAIIPASTWTRVSGVIDLSADTSNKLIVRLDNNASGTVVLYDGIMLEAQVGSLTTPSVYHEPPNFQNTYTGDLNATLGANFLNTYTIPTGTIPSSLTLTTGNYAMTYTAATGTLTKTGGLFTVASVNLNAGGATTLSTVATNIITTTSAHGYAQQNCVVYTHNGTTISGLVSGTCYYIIYLSATTFSLSATIPTATNGTGTAIVLGAVTAGTTYSFNSVDYITTTAAHGFLQGSTLRYNYSSGGTTIGGLTYGGSYWAAYLSATTFALATSAVNAGALSGGIVSSVNLGAMTAGTTYYFNWIGWQNSAYSTNSFTGGAQVSFTTVAIPAGTSMQYMVGLNSDPTLNNSYASLDYCIYISNGTQYIYESGVLVTKANTFSAYTVGDTFSIIYDGANLVNYYKNGSLFYSTYLKDVITTPLFLDSSFVEYGDSCTNLKFNAYSAPTLLSGTNITGMIHAANASDHLSDNVISTNTVIPQSVSSLEMFSAGYDITNLEFDIAGFSTFYGGSLYVFGDKYTQTLVQVGLSNVVKSLTSFPVGIVVTMQSQHSIDNLLTTYTFKQAYEPVSNGLNSQNMEQWYKTADYIVSFNAATAVNITTNVITTTASNFITGSEVILEYDWLDPTFVPIGGLNYGTPYFVIKLTSTTLKLAASLDDAMASVPIAVDLTSVGVSTHNIVSPFLTGQVYMNMSTRQFNVIPTATGVNISTDTFTVSSTTPIWNTGIYTGMEVIYFNDTAGADIAPLVYGTSYYIIKVSATTFKLATTLANATAGVAINITAVSTGTLTHSFTGRFRWVLANTGSDFNISTHSLIGNSDPKSTSIMDIVSMGGRTENTYHLYISFALGSVTNVAGLDPLTFDYVFSALSSKR